MPTRTKAFAAPLACLLAIGAVGCTLFPEKKPPTLATTTSAEQHDRILWQMVEKQQWVKLQPLLSSTLVWHNDGKALDREQVVAYLQSLNLKDAVVRDAAVKPNGPDMTVTYTLEVAGAGGAPQDFSAFSVWQQLKGGSYVLIAHSQSGTSAAAPAASR